MLVKASTVYEKAVTTHRSGKVLARAHGFKDVAELSKSLPPSAKVLDVGAGASTLGREIAARRPDIVWTNLDYNYRNSSVLDEVQQDAPENVKYIAGDATKLTGLFKPGTFDAVFSYWLFPHLSLDDELPARKAAEEIYKVTASGGYMSIGPKINRSRLLVIKARPAYQARKVASLNEQTYADKMVTETKLKGAELWRQKLITEVATPYFGTTRYAIPGKLVMKIYHPGTETYVSAISLRGIKTFSKILLAGIRYLRSRRKTAGRGE